MYNLVVAVVAEKAAKIYSTGRHVENEKNEEENEDKNKLKTLHFCIVFYSFGKFSVFFCLSLGFQLLPRVCRWKRQRQRQRYILFHSIFFFFFFLVFSFAFLPHYIYYTRRIHIYIWIVCSLNILLNIQKRSKAKCVMSVSVSLSAWKSQLHNFKWWTWFGGFGQRIECSCLGRRYHWNGQLANRLSNWGFFSKFEQLVKDFHRIMNVAFVPTICRCLKSLHLFVIRSLAMTFYTIWLLLRKC